MCDYGYEEYKFYIDRKAMIYKEGVDWKIYWCRVSVWSVLYKNIIMKCFLEEKIKKQKNLPANYWRNL